MVIDVFRYTHFHSNRNSAFRREMPNRKQKINNKKRREKKNCILARGRLRMAFGEVHSHNESTNERTAEERFEWESVS